MARIGCKITGDQNDSKFSEPMPWIGLYVAAASATCAIFMTVDFLHALRYRKLWFPCKFFSLNATTLTLVAVATKLSVDLNTIMPRQQDQLAKLSSAVFICVVMANSMPSIGIMDNTNMFVNIIALSILVLTVTVNICIQLFTGVIYVFWKEHIFVIIIMIFLLAISCSSALASPSTKSYLEKIYINKHRMAIKECSDKIGIPQTVRLREGLTKYWMMAYTSSPQFILGHSSTCIASGLFCLLGMAILAQALIRTYTMPYNFKFCIGESDYKRSTMLVFVSQTFGAAVGTVAPMVRWFMAVNFRCPKKANNAMKDYIKVEKYWIKVLVELRDYPVTAIISNRRVRRFGYQSKIRIVGFLIRLQMMIVMMSKLAQLLSIFTVQRFLILHSLCKRLRCLIKCSSSDEIETNMNSNPNLDLTRYVMYLEGEESTVDLVMRNNCNAVNRWIKLGEKQEPKYLIQFLEKFNSSQGFKGVTEFDNDSVPSLESEDPPNCWALPVVTLTSIAVSLPDMSNCSIEHLLNSVSEALIFVRVVETNLDFKQEVVSVRKAAEFVWETVNLYHKWLNIDLDRFKGKTAKETLVLLADIAKNQFLESKKRDLCLKVLAANSMYRISNSVLLKYENEEPVSNERVFEDLCFMICNILSACYTNLGHVMTIKCHCSSIEDREESVRSAILLFGKTDKILKTLEWKQVPGLDPNQLGHIDFWRLSMKQVVDNFDNNSLG